MRTIVKESHVESTWVQFDSRELRELIIDALKRKGVDTKGDVQLKFHGTGYQDTSGEIGGGPNLYVDIRRDLTGPATPAPPVRKR